MATVAPSLASSMATALPMPREPPVTSAILPSKSILSNLLEIVKSFFKTFDIESVFAYLLKLEMIERWVVLDKARGEKTFREIVSVMKKGGENALDEFKRNNNK